MGELGKIKPHPMAQHYDDNSIEWRLPVMVLSDKGQKSYKIIDIIEDEGYLVINIEVPVRYSY